MIASDRRISEQKKTTELRFFLLSSMRIAYRWLKPSNEKVQRMKERQEEGMKQKNIYTKKTTSSTATAIAAMESKHNTQHNTQHREKKKTTR